jgi:plasmid stability protein
MSNLLIKNFPDAVLEALKERAKFNNRSVNDEALFILEEALTKPRVSLLSKSMKKEIDQKAKKIETGRAKGIRWKGSIDKL